MAVAGSGAAGIGNASAGMGGVGGGKAPTSDGLNIPELEKQLARFGVTLNQLCFVLGLTPEELAHTHVTLSDIREVGITLQQLMFAGVTLEDLEKIGVDTSM
jgi:hypothetical protein